jgi:UPF0755 protein
MRRFLTLFLLAVLLTAGIFAWKIFGSGTGFPEKTKTFIIDEGGSGKNAVMTVLKEGDIINSPAAFSFLGSRLDIWGKIRPGKYEVKKGASLLDIVRMLKNGRLAEFKLVIKRIRIREDLARLISKNFKPDSASVMNFISSNDSLKKFDVDTTSLFTMIMQDTYFFYWNTSISRILQKLKDAGDAFWQKNERLQKAKEIGFKPGEIYTLASILDEESNIESDKYKIASVYINRLNIGMPLQADPTVKYAMKNFTLNRIYFKHLQTPSPYNTYRNKGLPPGPICTPLPKTIDIILNAPKTDYLYFVVKSDFSGYHQFSSTIEEHERYAKEYHKALDAYMARKQQKSQP